MIPPEASAPHCPLCGSADARPWATTRDLEYRTSDETFDYLACEPCGILFIDPMPVDRLAEIYPPNYYSFGSEGTTLVHRVKRWLDRRRFARLLRAIPGETLSVLDVGGGTGAELDTIRKADSRVGFTEVVDLDAAAVRKAVERGHAGFHGPIESWRGEHRFDLVLLLNLIEHVADPASVLRSVAAMLSENGVLLIQTPNIASLDARCFRHRDWAGLHCPRHWILFQRRSLVRLAEETGLTIRRFEYTQGAPFWTLSILFELERRGWIRIDEEHPAIYHPLYSPLAGAFACFDLVRRLLGGQPSQMMFELTRAE